MSGLFRNNESFVSKAFFYSIIFLTILLFVCTISACSSDDDKKHKKTTGHTPNSIEWDYDGDRIIDRIDYFTLDADENIVEIQEDWGLDGTIDRVVAFTYDTDGKTREERDNDNDGTIDEVLTFSYIDGLLIMQEWDRHYDGTTFNPDHKILFFYNDVGKIDREEWDIDNNGSIDEIHTLTYNPDGEYIRSEIDSNVDGLPDSIEYYTYDINDKLIQKDNDYYNDGEIDEIEYFEYSNIDGDIEFLKSDIVDELNPGTIDLIEYYYHTYVAGIKTTEILEDVGLDTVFDNSTTITYDLGEGIFVKKLIDEDNDGDWEKGYFPIIDEDTGLIERDEVKLGPYFAIVTEVLYYYYDAGGILERVEVDYNSNGVIDRVQLNTIDGNGNITEEYYDHNYNYVPPFDPNRFYAERVYYNTYDVSGNQIKKEFNYDYDDGNNNSIDRTIWYMPYIPKEDYGSDGHEEYDTIWSFPKPEPPWDDDIHDTHVILTYDSEGHLLTEEIDQRAGPLEAPDGLIDHITEYEYSYKTFISKKEFDYGYDTLIDRIDYFDWNVYKYLIWEKRDLDNSGLIDSGDTVIKYDYDGDGLLVEEKWDDDYSGTSFDPATTDPVTIDYDKAYYYVSYDNSKYFKREFDDLSIGVDPSTESVTYYYYETYSVDREIDNDANPDVDAVVYYKYDENWNCIEEKWDDDGDGEINRISTRQYDSQNRIRLDAYDANYDGVVDRYKLYYYDE